MIVKRLRRAALFTGMLLLSMSVIGQRENAHAAESTPGLEILVEKKLCPTDCPYPEGTISGGYPYWNEGAGPREQRSASQAETQWIIVIKQEGVQEALGR